MGAGFLFCLRRRGSLVFAGTTPPNTLFAMTSLLHIATGIDRISRVAGHIAAWLGVLMIALGATNALARYLGRYLGANLSSNAYLELQWYLFAAMFLLAGAHTLQRGAHVRVDVVSSRLSLRANAWIQLLGTLLLLLPFCVVALWVSWPSVVSAWQLREMSPDPGGLPRYPLRTLLPIAFTLLLLQGLAEAIRNIARVRGHEIPREEPSDLEST